VLRLPALFLVAVVILTGAVDNADSSSSSSSSSTTTRATRTSRPTTGGSAANNSLWALRGSQSTAAFYPSMFRTWPEFREYVKAQAAFGTNQIEMGGAPVCDANGSIVHTRVANSTLCEASVAALVQFSAELQKLGMNVSMGLPLDAFTGPQGHLLAKAWRLMPKLDSVFFPGGDGGSLVWSGVEEASNTLRLYHPGAQVWVSAQEYNATELDDFFHVLSLPHTRKFLSGVVAGPHWSIPLTEIVKRVQPGYLLRQYPDICHSLQAQYAIPDWHWAWQFTHGRENINPMPLMTDRIVRLRGNGSTPTFGVGAYSGNSIIFFSLFSRFTDNLLSARRFSEDLLKSEW
jgi:hypothetical protein